MTDPTPEDCKRLGHELIARRVALGYRTRSGFAKAKGYKNDRVITAIENAERTNFSSVTISVFEFGYGWERGSVDDILRGGEPRAWKRINPPGLRVRQSNRSLTSNCWQSSVAGSGSGLSPTRSGSGSRIQRMADEAARTEEEHVEMMWTERRKTPETPNPHPLGRLHRKFEQDVETMQSLQDLEDSQRLPDQRQPAPPLDAAADDSGAPSRRERERQAQDDSYDIDQDRG